MRTILILANEVMLDAGNIGGECAFFDEYTLEGNAVIEEDSLMGELVSATWLKISLDDKNIIRKLETRVVFADYKAVDGSWISALSWKCEGFQGYYDDRDEYRVCVGKKFDLEYSTAEENAIDLARRMRRLKA